jgi:Carboxypeptidase regulatory-like domain
MCPASRVLFVVALCLVAVPALAQQQASVSGRVVDASGLGLPGATVTVTSQSTGFTRTVVTAETGGYAVPNLAWHLQHSDRARWLFFREAT